MSQHLRKRQSHKVERMDLFAISKTVIEYLARGIEFAAALIIAVAAERRRGPLSASCCPSRSQGRRASDFRKMADCPIRIRTCSLPPQYSDCPSWSDIQKLVAIAALRTALNTLEKEIRQESRPDQKQAETRLLSNTIE